MCLALKVYYSYRENCKNLFQKNINKSIPIEVSKTVMRIMRLNLPHTKGMLIQQVVCGKINATWIVDDSSSNFANLLEGRLSDQLLDRIVGRALGILTEEERNANSERFKEIADVLVRDKKGQKKVLEGLEINRQFALLIYCLKNPTYKIAIEPIFFNLINAAIEETMAEDQCVDLIRLAKLHPDLIVLLGEGPDKVWIRVLDKEVNAPVTLEASCLLLGRCCGYFQELVKKKSLFEFPKTHDESREIDLSERFLDKKIMVVLLRWLINSDVVVFSVEGKKRKFELAKLQHILTHFSALHIYNHEEFLEKLQMGVMDFINDERLVQILDFSLRFKLAMVEAACIEYINNHPSMAYSILRHSDNSFGIIKRMGIEAPLILQKAVALLTEKISIGYIEQKPQNKSKKGCLIRTKNAVKGLWNVFGGLIRRTAIFSGSIVGIQSIARIPLWSFGKTIGVGCGVGVSYSIISFIFEKCVVIPIMRRHQISVIRIPDLARTQLRCVTRISRCFNRCCISSSPIVIEAVKQSTFPIPLLHIDLSKATEITDINPVRIFSPFIIARFKSIKDYY